MSGMLGWLTHRPRLCQIETKCACSDIFPQHHSLAGEKTMLTLRLGKCQEPEDLKQAEMSRCKDTGCPLGCAGRILAEDDVRGGEGSDIRLH